MPRCARGLDASTYFARSGIAELAENNEGLCTFWLETTWRSTRRPTRPSSTTRIWHPRSMRTPSSSVPSSVPLPAQDERRKAKRAVVERVLGSNRFVTSLDPHVREMAQHYLRRGGRSLAALAGLLPAHGSAHRQRVARRPGFSSKPP